ncbi:ABC transporter permease [Skermanella pratensis]|uniref:ABC transporter permease n=1 Tax=Skermanella pratensis TaxID=2233999 RepID=UPI0013013F21|nr:ABC transporter permease [Skermanella pratensis]
MRPILNLPPHATPAQRAWHVGLWAITILVLGFLVLPILVIVPLSFSSGSFLNFPLPGLSLRWYQELLGSERWLSSLRNSVVVACAATLFATILGTLAALGLQRASFPGRSLLLALVISPMVVPLVIVAVGVYFFYAPLGLTGSLVGLTLAHTALAVPFVVITVSATLQGFDTNLSRAAASLGADPATAFFRITLPIILPGVVSGALFAFVTSFDEVVVALFLTGPQERTLPRQMFDGIRENISPVIAAAATLLIVLSILLMTVMEVLRRRGERLRGIR